MKNISLYTAIFWLSLFGILLASYLLFEQIIQSPFQPCNINNTINCNAIISGPISQTFDLPTPLIGLIGYVVILFSILFKQGKLLLASASFGLLFCLWIGYQELFILHVICPVCILCQFTILFIFICALIAQKREIDREFFYKNK